MSSSSTVRTLLKSYGQSTKTYVQAYLDSQPKSPYLHRLLTDYPARGGKMMRPCLCIATACAFGAKIEDVLPFAAAIELLHNALLIHDDIQDQSEERRGLPTLHAIHGVPLAINAGDALLMLALGPLLDRHNQYGYIVAEKILDCTQRMARETAEGQALEIGWRQENRLDISSADYLQMVLKKTAWMATIWPTQIGVLIGSRGRVDPMSVVRFGFFLGAAFQIQDDVLNLKPDTEYGKELNGDLYEAKKTLMLIHARENSDPEDVQKMDSILSLSRSERTQSDVNWLAKQMEKKSSIKHARTVAEALAGAALHEFSMSFGHLPASPDKAFLEGLIGWVFQR